MKFGIIGTGWITETYIDGAIDSGLWELAAIYSRTKERGLAFGNKYNVTNIFTDIHEMSASDDLDAVYIASPNALHFEHCCEFLKNGKHVICEKPIASHVEQVKELYRIADEHAVIFLEAIMYLHLPTRKLLEKAIKKIGNISLATFDFSQRSSKYDQYLAGGLPNIFNPQLETGALMDLGIYCLYPALALFGAPQDFIVDVSLLPTGVDACGVINLKYTDKLVCIRYSKIGQAGANSDIQGDYGTINIESISRLDNIDITYSDNKKEHVCVSEEKFKLMGYEAKDFYKYIMDPKDKAYFECRELSIMVADLLECIRTSAGIKFPSDN